MAEEQYHSARVREHLANERTLLSWIRTWLSMMGFGVLIAKLRLQLALTKPKSFSSSLGARITRFAPHVSATSFGGHPIWIVANETGLRARSSMPNRSIATRSSLRKSSPVERIPIR